MEFREGERRLKFHTPLPPFFFPSSIMTLPIISIEIEKSEPDLPSFFLLPPDFNFFGSTVDTPLFSFLLFAYLGGGYAELFEARIIS